MVQYFVPSGYWIWIGCLYKPYECDYEQQNWANHDISFSIHSSSRWWHVKLPNFKSLLNIYVLVFRLLR